MERGQRSQDLSDATIQGANTKPRRPIRPPINQQLAALISNGAQSTNENGGGSGMQLTLWLFLTAGLCLAGPPIAADKPLVVDLWPGKGPDAIDNMGEEKVLMSAR